jgi:hypothetical protein
MSFSDYYKELGSLITVESIMTPKDELYCGFEGIDKKTFYDVLDKETYDQAPFIESASDRKIKGYILKEELSKELNSSKRLKDMYHPLDDSRLITYSTPVVTALKKIIVPKFLFVLKDTEVCGLLTYSDFDKRPMRLHIYLLIGELESNLLLIMKRTNNDDHWMSKIPGRRGTIEGYFERRKRDDNVLRKVECFGLKDMFKALSAEMPILQKLDLARYDYDFFTERLGDLRDEVSHQGIDIALNPQSLEELLETKDNLIHLVRKSEGLLRELTSNTSS